MRDDPPGTESQAWNRGDARSPSFAPRFRSAQLPMADILQLTRWPGRDRSASIISSHREENSRPRSLSPIRNIVVNDNVAAMEPRRGPIYDLLSHDLHAAAASGRAEFWMWVSRNQSFRDRNRTMSWGVG